MANESKVLLRQLNPFLDLSFSNVSIDNFHYHTTATWPVNIMSLVLEDDGKDDNYLENVVEKRRFMVRAGQVFFIPCGLKTHFEITPGITAISLHFNLTFFHGIDIFAGVTHFEERHDPEMVARFRSILDEKDELKAICELKAEVMRFCAACWPENRGQLTPAIRKYEPVFQFVRERCDATLNVGVLAAVAGQRRDTFSRSFSRDIGKSPKEFLQDELLKKVATSLLLPRVGVKQVADELKFCSEFYLSYFFKRRTGLSPRDYQKRFRHC